MLWNRIWKWSSPFFELEKKARREGNLTAESGVKHIEECLVFYEHTLHHKLRGGWARVNGLIHLMHISENKDDQKEIMQRLLITLVEIDKSMAEVGRQLDFVRKNTR